MNSQDDAKEERSRCLTPMLQRVERMEEENLRQQMSPEEFKRYLDAKAELLLMSMQKSPRQE